MRLWKGKNMANEIFNRVEKKYLLNEEQYHNLIILINEYMNHDKFYKSTICNIYFDTDDYELVRTSIEKPIYKEKLRLRSYNVPSLDDEVFFEIKKKYNSIVNKRRITLSLKDYYKYINMEKISNKDSQISKEIIYMIKHYNLKPKVFLAYDRKAYISKQDKNLRITIDNNIRSRNYDLKLEHGDKGELLSDEKYYLMEIKSLNGYPRWLVECLSNNNIFPKTFSKYGNVYKKMMKEGIINV